MKKHILCFLFAFACFGALYAQCPTSVTDGSGNSYTVVRLGAQCWTATNMRTTLYSDGETVEPAGMELSSYMYTDIPVETNGLLYTAAAAMRNYDGTAPMVQGICPDGWHIPSQAEMNSLLAAYDVRTLMTEELWLPTGGSNAYGFAMLPVGFYNGASATFEGYRVSSILWTTEPGSTVYHPCEFGAACGTWEYIPGSATGAYSVRCISDASALATPTVQTVEATYSGTTATLAGKVLSEGSEPVTDYGIYYSTNRNSGYTLLSTLTGDVTDFSGNISHAQYDVTYYYYAFAVNLQGTAYGDTLEATRDFICVTDKVKDAADNEYTTVEIGSQCWMDENLRLAAGLTQGNDTSSSSALYYLAGNDASNTGTYGLLYNYAAATATGTCPDGWHLPSADEWATLGSSMTAPYAGLYSIDGYQNFFSRSTYFWTATAGDASNTARYVALTKDVPGTLTGTLNRVNGCSVRCLRNN